MNCNFLLAGLSLFSYSIYAQSPDKTKPQTKTHAQNTRQLTPPIGPAEPIYQVAPVNVADGSQQEARKWWQPWKDAFISNWPLILIGGGGTWVALRTLKAIEEQVKANQESARAAYRQVNTARHQTTVAIHATRLAENTALLTERADVLIQHVNVSTGKQLNRASEIELVFKNFGRTRASNVEVSMGLEFAEVPKHLTRIPDSAVIGPGDDIRPRFRPLGTCMKEATCNDIRTGKGTLQFHAEVTYKDVFGKIHFTRCSGIYDSPYGGFHVSQYDAT